MAKGFEDRGTSVELHHIRRNNGPRHYEVGDLVVVDTRFVSHGWVKSLRRLVRNCGAEMIELRGASGLAALAEVLYSTGVKP
jgi:hypothetical protein